MNILLLGNGFDLHHKLPTAYIDFLHTIDFLVNNYDESTMTNVAKIFGDERLKSKCKNISDSFDEYDAFYKETPLDKNKVSFLIEKAKTNLWFKYFVTTIKEELTWIDFEERIANVINAFNIFFSNQGEPALDEDDEKDYCIVSQFVFFSDREDDGYFWDVDEIKDSFIKKTTIGTNTFCEMDKDKIIDGLYLSLREFADMLKIYLKLFIDSTTNTMEEFGFTIRNSSYPVAHKVFTFNYTNTVEKLYTSEDVVCHIHGNVDNEIVLGINPDEYDELGNIDTSFIRFKKYFQRVFYKTDVDYLRETSSIDNFKNIIPKDINTITLYVIGHSLDETDKDVIQEIFERVGKIKIFYHNDEAVGTYIKNLIAIYGKRKFDLLRLSKGIEFLPHEPSELYHA